MTRQDQAVSGTLAAIFRKRLLLKNMFGMLTRCLHWPRFNLSPLIEVCVTISPDGFSEGLRVMSDSCGLLYEEEQAVPCTLYPCRTGICRKA